MVPVGAKGASANGAKKCQRCWCEWCSTSITLRTSTLSTRCTLAPLAPVPGQGPGLYFACWTDMKRKARRPFKPIKDQVIVITGASSGIGLATARMAGRRGARVVLAARNHDDLRNVTYEIIQNGGKGIAGVADVADPDARDRIGDTA